MKKQKKIERSKRPSKRITSKYEFEDLIKLPKDSYELVKPDKLKPHPQNPNKHSKGQVERLSKIIATVGFRHPIIISRQTGYIVSGHGRLQALEKLGWSHVPVQYQSFKSAAEEYSVLVSDNAIADWSTLDLAQINNDFHNYGPDLDIDLLGINEFKMNFEVDSNSKSKEVSFTVKESHLICPHCGEQFEKSQAQKVE